LLLDFPSIQASDDDDSMVHMGIHGLLAPLKSFGYESCVLHQLSRALGADAYIKVILC
jgi:glutamate synthase (NADPH/NADH)